MLNQEIAIVSAFRTAIGNFNGTIANVSAHALGSHIIKKIISDSKIEPSEISEVILGHVLTAGGGQNTARQAAINAGIPYTVPAWTVSHVCGSGLQSIILGIERIALGHSQIVIAGGQENMSSSMHAMHMRNGVKIGNGMLVDTMIIDGLTDAFSHVHMGMTAENIAERFNISRQAQDEFAAHSQMKATEAQAAGKFQNEIVPLSIETKGDIIQFDRDEFIRPDVSLERLAKLRPAFKKDGTVTAGNASGINDGAAAVLLMSHAEAKRRNLKPMAIIKSFGYSGVDPQIMGTAPAFASKKALSMANWQLSDLDLIEANEAFAVQSVYVNQEMGWDEKKVNVNGGSIAIGHPIGASGARILVTLLHEMQKRNSNKGLATLCIGGGMGIAICIEKSK